MIQDFTVLIKPHKKPDLVKVIASKRPRWLENLARMEGISMVRPRSWEIQVAREGREDPGKSVRQFGE
jgi:hypothetical protein